MTPCRDEPCPAGEPVASALQWQPARAGNRPPLVDSETLMHGHRTIEISHQGKLILTK